MTTRWDADLGRDDLLALSPDEALAGGLTAARPAEAPPLDTVCALALAYQAAEDGAPEDVLGLGLVAFAQVRDTVGTTTLPAAAVAELARRVAQQTEGYPRTTAWLAALAAAATSGAELDRAQAFLARAIELMRRVAGARAGTWRP